MDAVSAEVAVGRDGLRRGGEGRGRGRAREEGGKGWGRDGTGRCLSGAAGRTGRVGGRAQGGWMGGREEMGAG